MSTWRIRPLIRGEVLAEKSEILAYQDPGIKEWVPSIVWYLTDGDHHVLVDTGFGQPAEKDACIAGYSVRSSQPLEVTLQRAGLPATSVAAVILTHLHWDHCGNLQLFPQARILLQREEVRYAVAPLEFEAEAYNSPCVGGTPGWLDRRMSFLDGDAEILPGLRVLPTPGHTPGHQSVLVDTRVGTCGIAGDLLPTYANIEYGSPRMFYPPACFDYGSWHRSVHRLACVCDVLLPSHDPALSTDWIPSGERRKHGRGSIEGTNRA